MSSLPQEHIKKLKSGQQIEDDVEIQAPAPKFSPPKIPKEEAFTRLDIFEEEARAGAPDSWLATQAVVSKSVVLEWRRLRKISRLGVNDQRLSKWALDLADGPYDPTLHTTRSAVAGTWAPPQYVVRRALHYTEFCRHIWFLNHVLGSGFELIAKALGLRPEDVEMAVRVWASHLQRNGRNCKRCGDVIDPKYGRYCSERCEIAP